jgi:hypothetical protein
MLHPGRGLRASPAQQAPYCALPAVGGAGADLQSRNDAAVTGNKKPKATPGSATMFAQATEPSKKIETAASADCDEDEDDAVTEKPAVAPKDTRSPAQTTPPRGEVETGRRLR